MRGRQFRVALAIAFATTAWDRLPSATYAQAPVDIQQITNVVRTIGEIADRAEELKK